MENDRLRKGKLRLRHIGCSLDSPSQHVTSMFSFSPQTTPIAWTKSLKLHCYKCFADNRMTAKEAIGAFYDEIKLYNFDKPNPSPDNGHLTQLLWKGSKKTGSGEVKFVNGKLLSHLSLSAINPQLNY